MGQPRFRGAALTHLRIPQTRLDLHAARQEFVFDLRPGLPDTSSFPFEVWGRLAGRALRTFARSSARYREPAGHPGLRDAIAKHLSFTRAMACDPQDVIVTVGAQQAFGLLAHVLVTDKRRVVAVEDPGYPATRGAFAAAGACIRGVPVDAYGLQVDRIPRDAKVVCVTPSHQFPLGVPMPHGRRRELLAYAAERDALIIEDDYGGEFRFGGAPIAALHTSDRERRTFYVGTFSQSLLPALRIGFIVSPPWAREALIAHKELLDWHGPAIEHGTLAAFMLEGHLARHIRKMRRIYAERRLELLRALREHCGRTLQPMKSVAGLHVAALLRPSDHAQGIAERAARASLGVEPLSRYTVKRPAPPGLVLGFGLIERHRIDEAIRALARAIGH